VIRVVIDTNVLVSALLTSGGLPEAVIDLAISGEVQWFASESAVRVAAASDTDDNRVLECAEAAQARYLVTI